MDTTGATTEAGEPEPCGRIGSTVWYTFTPSTDGAIVADTIGSGYDTALAAYTGSDLSNLVNVACNDDWHGFQSEITFAVEGGETYVIQVGGFAGDTGSLTLNVDEAPPPPPPATNDDFAEATLIEQIPFGDELSTVGTTDEPGEPSPCAEIGSTVWYVYTPAADGSLVIDTFGSGYDTALAAYTGSDLSNLVNVACNDDYESLQSRIAFGVSTGVTYYVQVGGFFGDTGDLVLNVEEGPCPSGPPDEGPVTGIVHEVEPATGPAGETIHGVNCEVAKLGL